MVVPGRKKGGRGQRGRKRWGGGEREIEKERGENVKQGTIDGERGRKILEERVRDG